jgi:hypothetical protein
MLTCSICGNKAPLFLSGVCTDACLKIQHICSTSVEEGLRYGIPGASLETLQAAEEYECRHSGRVTILNAIHRAMRKLKKAGGAK